MKGWAKSKKSSSYFAKYFALFVLVAGVGMLLGSPAQAAMSCNRTLTADIVAFDMPLMFNRYGAQNINGMMFALRRDVVDKTSLQPIGSGGMPGDVTLRPDKRPRPLVLRMGAGDCLTYKLTNLLDPVANPFAPVEERSGIDFTLNIDDQVAARDISLRFQGTEVVGSAADDGSYVGQNASSLVAQGTTSTPIKIYAPMEGAFLGTSYGATFGGEGLGGNTANGLWAVLNVGPINSAFYRSQVTREEMDLATIKLTAGNQPVINYEETYPSGEPWASEGKAGLPILNMVQDGKIVHSEINAIVAYGPYLKMINAPNGPYKDKLGHFPKETYPLESVGKRNPTLPNRLEPFRDLTVAFHDEVTTKQAFPRWFEDPVLQHTLHGVRDSFMINYGSGGIGSEIIASRLRVGPPHDCVNCMYEEFFLTAFTVSDVAQLTDIPANFGLENCVPTLASGCAATGPKANYALFPDDPSNVHHSYTGEFVKMRNVHAGPGEQHVFHQHNHQWLFNANDDNSNYLDAQGLGPGAGYTYEFVNGGAGNRNKTAGDAIFHCHFYPHFAQGMWEMWRVHDVLEVGTELQATADGTDLDFDGVSDVHISFADPMGDGLGLGNGTPEAGARALPDAEIIAGTPIPGVVPMPGKPLPPMPVDGVTVKANPNEVCVGPAPTYGLAAKVGGVCPAGTAARSTGSLADVPDPLPADFGLKTAGYPFWVAGIEHSVGQRPPTPPLDMITWTQADNLKNTDAILAGANGVAETIAHPDDIQVVPVGTTNLNPDTVVVRAGIDGILQSSPLFVSDDAMGVDSLWQHPGFDGAGAIHGWDGGLPRFSADGFSAGSEAIVSVLEARLDLSKEVTKIKPFFYPEEGTEVEKAAMAYHANRNHSTYISDQVGTTPGSFVLNGALPVPGAPYNEPCIDDSGNLLKNGVTGDFFDGDVFDEDGALGVYGSSPFNAENPRVYKAANVQIDAVFNKLGYHYPQERIIALWQDVVPSVLKQRPPEPFVMRMNTFDCTQFVHSNVVPKTYELDDYQVRTPTDIIGQHIHLPKWDLTTADGAANGWNYEDGTLSPGAIIEIIEAINYYNASAKVPVTTNVEGNPVVDSYGHSLTVEGVLEPSAHPFFGGTSYGTCPDGPWCGARSTMQRWFADPVVNVQGIDRGLGIIFTHDHYGPSTHQQVGLYATMLIEPAGSEWLHNETGTQLYSRTGTAPEADGGPTSWQAAILTGSDSRYTGNVGAKDVESYREFYLEYTDFQHAYQHDVYVGADEYGFPLADYHFSDSGIVVGGPGQTANGKLLTAQGLLAPDPNSFRQAIQPAFRQEAEPTVSADGFPTDIWVFPPFCPHIVNGVQVNDIPRPCPEAITADDPGMYVVNYRNESLAARIFDPERDDCPDDSNKSDGLAEHGGCQAKGRAGDLAFAMSSGTKRAIPDLNDELGLAPATYADGYCDGGVFCPPINDLSALGGGDPFTPMLRTFEGDRVHLKVQAGGQEEEFTNLIHGLKWLQAGSGFGEAKNSGWRNAQPGGISEQFTLRMPVLPDKNQTGAVADYAYSTNPSLDGWVSGTWGILRSYRSSAPGALEELPENPGKKVKISNAGNFDGVCPSSAPVRQYDITAVLAEDVLFHDGTPDGVTIQDLFPSSHEGRSPEGPGTLIYNSRATTVAGTIEARGSDGPTVLHDPTAILYVETKNLIAYGDTDEDGNYDQKGQNVEVWDDRCLKYERKVKGNATLPTCPVYLKASVPVEPIVVRANAGDCIEVTLRNKLLQQARTDDIYEYEIFNDLGKPVFEDEGETKHLEKGLNADTDGDGILDYVVNHQDVKFDSMPDLATGNATTAMVRRDDKTNDTIQGMSSFQTNLMAPSACVGLHPSLVEYDVTRDDGTAVGQNNPSLNILCPNQTLNPTYRWYAGHIDPQLKTLGKNAKRPKEFEYVATPIEFGGFNIMAADKLEQGQKGLIGAGVIYPEGSYWMVDAGTNMVASICNGPCVDNDDDGKADNVAARDFVVVAQKGASMFYSDSYPVENILGEGKFGVAEDSQDMGQMAINYGTEPMWFRYGLNPTDDAGFMTIGNAADAYSNSLIGPKTDPASDPQTAVFNVTAGQEFRKHLLMPFGPGRGSTYDLHGHVWQRDPYICPGSDDAANLNGIGLAGKCDTGDGFAGVPKTPALSSGEVGSKALGYNPIGMGIGGIESWFPGEHYEIFIPSAGGSDATPGDYLFRDHMGLGSAQGLWGIIRVELP